ncbi:hypothetical protein [uncultured Tateyamaria sp.]|nr:hypothetical protein [uncultured Tateyamaria sp.]
MTLAFPVFKQPTLKLFFSEANTSTVTEQRRNMPNQEKNVLSCAN